MHLEPKQKRKQRIAYLKYLGMRPRGERREEERRRGGEEEREGEMSRVEQKEVKTIKRCVYNSSALVYQVS